jgi:hypothetical protein
MRLNGVFLVFCGLLASVPAMAAELPIITQDEQGVPIEAVVSKQEYSRRLSRLVEATQQSAMPALQALKEKQGWKLRTVLVGVGVSLGAGLGPILQVNATPRFRLAFSNNSDPAFP